MRLLSAALFSVTLVFSCLIFLALGNGAEAMSGPTIGTAAATGLFAKSCMTYAGRADALRNWVRVETAFSRYLPRAEKTVLRGEAGRVYGISAMYGDYMLVSFDDGRCSLTAYNVASARLFDSFETAMRQSAMTTTLTANTVPPSAHDYDVSGKGRAWHVKLQIAGPSRAIMTARGDRQS